MGSCRVLTTSTRVSGWPAASSRSAGVRSVEVAVPTVPTRSTRLPWLRSPAASRNRATASSTASRWGSSSRPSREIRAPERRRSSSTTPSSASSRVMASDSAGWDRWTLSLARRRDPWRVTATTYSSCSTRMPSNLH